MDNELILPGDSHPTRADAVKNRALLLETAQRLFDEQGLDQVSMSAIAEAAGVGKGTLYRHFKNKSDLAYVLLDEEQRDLQVRVLRRLHVQDNPRDELRWFLEQVIRFVDRNQGLLCVAAQDGLTTLSSPAHLWWRQTIRGLLMRIQPAPTVGIDYLVDLLYILVDIQTIRFQKRTLGYDVTQILDSLNIVLSKLID